ncbi:MAG: MFS transporter [Azospirillaceae bacterium]|nr:MFS transporter [Azospirillaceae bacterium]
MSFPSRSFTKWLILLSACLTAVLIPLCFTGPAVALPAIHAALGGGPVALNWVVNGYILTYGGAMLAVGSLADTYGRKRVWLAGLAAFAAVTTAIPYAPNVLTLDFLRLAQGLAGSAAFAGAMAALTQEFSGPARTRVFSLLGTTFGLGLAFGPLLAGALVQGFGWHAVFQVPAALSVLSLLLTWMCAHETRDPGASGLDWSGALTFTGALTLFTHALLQAPEDGWSAPNVVAELVASALMLAAFVGVERRRARPMLDLSLFADLRFVGVQFLAASPAFAYVVLIILLPARFIGVEGYSPLAAGRLMIALSLPLLVVPFLAALAARWVTAGALSGLGLLIAAAGLLWLGGSLSAGGGALVPMAAIGIGIGLPWGLMDGLAVGVAPKERAGMAAGIFNAVRVAGDGIAIAVAGALLAAFLHTGLVHAGATGDLTLAANRAVLGDLGPLAGTLPSPMGARALYDGAFARLLDVLAAIAAVTALIVFAALGRVRAHDMATEAELVEEAVQA